MASEASTPRRNKNGLRRRATSVCFSLILPTLLIGAWHFSVALEWWPKSLIASPAEVVDSFVELFKSGELFGHTRESLTRLLLGFALGAVVGVCLGSLVGTWGMAERLLGASIGALIPVPPPAWIPLLIILLGIGMETQVALIAIGAFGVVYIATIQGIRSADQGLVEVASLYEKSRWQLIRDILLPSSVSNVMAGLRVALGLSWILLVAAEMIATPMAGPSARADGIGLGWLIFDARRFGRPSEMVLGMLTIGVLGKLTDYLMALIQRRLLLYRNAFGGV